ncbi:MAG: DegT/DnrJ/EryC1/StrS family aminotransferase, partial [Lentisphaerae bacterium]|nr:DegT/DnrJ/EryC1/StrS family aminotransferase [Lentisphaerota bacterium]
LHFRATHLQKYYQDTMKIKRGSLPNTEWNSDRILSLPLFPDMTIEDVNDVVSAIKEILNLRR